jgi:PadR family transcriptional regulator PadR
LDPPGIENPASLMSNDPGLPKNFLASCLMLLLSECPAHGYDLVERLQPFGFDGSDPGGIYRGLRGLESRGSVASTWRPSAVGPARRVYELTAQGEAELRVRRRELAHAHELLSDFLERCPGAVAWEQRRPRGDDLQVPRMALHPPGTTGT